MPEVASWILGVEQETDDWSFDVVADSLAAVAADPGGAGRPDVERRFFERLHEPAGGILKLVDVRRDCRQEVVACTETCADDDQLAVVAGEALGDPEAAGAGRVLVVERSELDGPEALDIERVEVLVADEREPAEVVGRI